MSHAPPLLHAHTLTSSLCLNTLVMGKSLSPRVLPSFFSHIPLLVQTSCMKYRSNKSFLQIKQNPTALEHSPIFYYGYCSSAASRQPSPHPRQETHCPSCLLPSRSSVSRVDASGGDISLAVGRAQTRDSCPPALLPHPPSNLYSMQGHSQQPPRAAAPGHHPRTQRLTQQVARHARGLRGAGHPLPGCGGP